MPTVRTVKSAEERNKGRGQFITLKKTNDQFMGYALFVADPEADENPGYYEYFEHYTPATGYCPCSGDDCPFCAEGDNPSSRAKSMWLVVDNAEDDPDSGEVKIFNLNYSGIQELAEDGAENLGRLFRVKRLEGNGVYSYRIKPDKLTKTQLKAAMKNIEDDQLAKTALRQLKRVHEEMDVEQAMEEDDDEKEEKTEPKSRKGKPVEEEETTAEFDPDSDDEFEGTVTVLKVNKKLNTADVETEDGTEFTIFGTDDDDLTEFSKGDEIEVEVAKDSDGDFVVNTLVVPESEEEEKSKKKKAEPEAEAEVPDEVEDETVTVVKVNSDEDTLLVEMEDGTQFELFFLGEGEDDAGNDWSDLDVDDYEEGQKIVVSAAKDQDGDLLAASFPKKVSGKKKAKA